MQAQNAPRQSACFSQTQPLLLTAADGNIRWRVVTQWHDRRALTALWQVSLQTVCLAILTSHGNGTGPADPFLEAGLFTVFCPFDLLCFFAVSCSFAVL